MASGCVSSSDIDAINSQLADIQRQVLQLQKETSSKHEIAALREGAESRTQELLRSQADVQVEIEDLSSQIQELQAKLEDTNYRLSQLSQQIAATNQELKTFRSARVGPPEPGFGDGTPPAGTESEGTDPRNLYQAAYNDYLRGNYDLAIIGFRQYLNSFPTTDLADNAAYWIGESHYRQGKYDEAARQFDTVLNQYPNSDKVPSAMLKKGYAYLKVDERSKGVVQLQHVIRRYPESDEADLARQQLDSLGVARDRSGE